MSRRVLVLGGASAIALAYCRRAAASGAAFVLVGRNLTSLEANAADLRARGATDAVAVAADLADSAGAERRFHDLLQLGMPDEIVLAYGSLGDQKRAETDPEETRHLLEVNFLSAAVWLQLAARHLPAGGDRIIIVIGSVAGDRGRASNYVYGAAKAGLEAFAEGLAHRLHAKGVRVLTVKPGFVDTPMTRHLDRSGPLWATPERVAASIERAVGRRRRVLYVPWFWQPIMALVRALPRPLFYRTGL